MAAAVVGSVLSAMGNFGQVADVAVGHLHQREQIEMARRAYRLDARTLRIDLLNAVKEDVRDHHNTHAGRIDTLLLVHTLLLTFALATPQFSDEYIPQTAESCPECIEVVYPMLVPMWVYLIGAILILPFWCILMLSYCKIKLDRWLEVSVRRLNAELRETLVSTSFTGAAGGAPGVDGAANMELESVEEAIARLGGFVADHQDSFAKIWHGECDSMVHVAANLLWVSAVTAVAITAGTFWMFLRNDLATHYASAMSFAILVVCGLIAPVGYYLSRRAQLARKQSNVPADYSPEAEVNEGMDFLQVDEALRCRGAWRMSAGSSTLASAVPRQVGSPASSTPGSVAT